MKTKLGVKMENIDKGGVVVALMLIVVAIIALWDTTHMVDPDSFMFPRAVAGFVRSCKIISIPVSGKLSPISLTIRR